MPGVPVTDIAKTFGMHLGSALVAMALPVWARIARIDVWEGWLWLVFGLGAFTFLIAILSRTELSYTEDTDERNAFGRGLAALANVLSVMLILGIFTGAMLYAQLSDTPAKKLEQALARYVEQVDVGEEADVRSAAYAIFGACELTEEVRVATTRTLIEQECDKLLFTLPSKEQANAALSVLTNLND
jgi:hypothetical protein